MENPGDGVAIIPGYISGGGIPTPAEDDAGNAIEVENIA